ncbi:DegV family protein with EDD domain [Natronobacillus azotifigens]|uniref:DegV family protein n=1 Tax=Natronobacillus azotifigens TaxID=472978 RepID=A0A9J6RBJ7_9BACI|nr:DegV family protein [Natronobacillus azotifigens]MCZ0702692.1 DegV family protein [Natronobacillus azotifigens]
MQIQLMTDSSADLPKELKEKLQVTIIPLFVHFGEEHFASEALTTEQFLTKLNESNVFPSSSASGPNEYYQAFKAVPDNKPIILFSVSEGVSSAYNHALMGKKMLLEEEPNRKIEIINSKSASPGLILLIDEAGKKLADGYSFEQLVPHLQGRVEKLMTLFVLKSLDNLIRGGRLDKMKGAIAKTLNIKLILHASSEGKIEVLEKVRGEKKVLRRFVEQIGEYIHSAEDKVIAMTHANARNRAEEILGNIITTYPFKETFLSETGPVISAHAGEEAIVISFFRD